MALDPELLLLRDDGEEEFGTCGHHTVASWLWLDCSPVTAVGFGPVWSLLQAYLRLSAAGAKLEDSEVRSVASNQSEMEFSSLQDMVRPLFHPQESVRLTGEVSDSLLGEGNFYHLILIDKNQNVVLGSWSGVFIGSRALQYLHLGESE